MEGRLPGKPGSLFTAFRFLPQVNSGPVITLDQYRLENSAGGGIGRFVFSQFHHCSYSTVNLTSFQSSDRERMTQIQRVL